MSDNDIDETALVARACAGDAKAFEVLVHRYQGRLLQAMMYICGSLQEAEDVVQETFIQAYLKLHTFGNMSRFYTWLYRIAINFALSRKRKRRERLSLDFGKEQLGCEPIDDEDLSPDKSMLQAETGQIVQLAIAALSEDHRVIIVLRDLHDLSYEAIADVLGINLGTVRSRLNRARTQLKSILESQPQWKPID